MPTGELYHKYTQKSTLITIFLVISVCIIEVIPYKIVSVMEMVDYALIGARIKAKRKEKGITQEVLAEKLSVSVGYISQLERGTTKINLEALAKIAAVTDCEIADFVSGASSQSSLYAQAEFAACLQALDSKERAVLLHQLKSYIAFRDAEN